MNIWLSSIWPGEKKLNRIYSRLFLSRCFHIFLEKRYKEIIGVFLCILYSVAPMGGPLKETVISDPIKHLFVCIFRGHIQKFGLKSKNLGKISGF